MDKPQPKYNIVVTQLTDRTAKIETATPQLHAEMLTVTSMIGQRYVAWTDGSIRFTPMSVLPDAPLIFKSLLEVWGGKFVGMNGAVQEVQPKAKPGREPIMEAPLPKTRTVLSDMVTGTTIKVEACNFSVYEELLREATPYGSITQRPEDLTFFLHPNPNYSRPQIISYLTRNGGVYTPRKS